MNNKMEKHIISENVELYINDANIVNDKIKNNCKNGNK